MTEWFHILTHSPRSQSRQSKYGILQKISDTTEYAIVYFPKIDESKHVHITWSERLPHLLECVEFCTAFRVEVYVEYDQIVTYHVSVNPMILKNQINNFNILGEHNIITLIKHMWKISYTHSEYIQPPSTTTLIDEDSESVKPIWKKNMILLDHQTNSLRYMKCTEQKIMSDPYFSYNYNIEIPNTDYFIDMVEETITTHAEPKLCKFRGAFLCDETCSGKTVVSLKLISEKSPVCKEKHNYKSKGTLVIVPLNLPSQWCTEIERFYEAESYTLVKLWKSSDLKNINMKKLLETDIIITTISFIRSCKHYNELFNTVIYNYQKGDLKKSRALFNSIARNPNIELPILQIIKWKRIIVDEIHEIKDKDLRILKCLNCNIMWGLTATPNLKINTKEDLNDLSFMLEDGWSNHPNIYKEYIHNFVKGYTDIQKCFPNNSLKLIHSFADEKERNASSDEEVIMNSSTFREGVTLCSDRKNLKNIILKPEKYQIDENSSHLLCTQKGIIATCLMLTALWCVEHVGNKKLKKCELSYKYLEVITKQKKHFDSISNLVTLIEKTKRQKMFKEENLKKLETKDEICGICMERVCRVIIRCGHVFCSECTNTYLSQDNRCPNCRTSSSISDAFTVINELENSKLQAIKHMSESTTQPMLIFAQYKRILRDLKLILEISGKHVFILEGNVSQRSNIIHDFKQYGGILLLCATDSFSGIRLHNVHHVIFAHALIGDYSKVKALELQAIARAMKQNEDISSLNVMSFVSEGQEENIWRMNHITDQKK